MIGLFIESFFFCFRSRIEKVVNCLEIELIRNMVELEIGIWCLRLVRFCCFLYNVWLFCFMVIVRLGFWFWLWVFISWLVFCICWEGFWFVVGEFVSSIKRVVIIDRSSCFICLKFCWNKIVRKIVMSCLSKGSWMD